MGVGLHELARRRNVEKTDGHRMDPVDFVSQGVSGTADAVKARAESSRDRSTSPRAKAAVAGAGLASGALGSHLTGRAIRHIGHGRRIAPALTALGGTAAGVASLPLTNRVASRRGYEVTATGVRRKKTPPVRPTRSATVVETRANRGAQPNARQLVVPNDRRFSKSSPRERFALNVMAELHRLERKDGVRKYYGENLSPNQKRARVIAAGAAPVVGPYAAAAQAARMAPPDQRHSAAALQYGGYAAGGLTGAAVGSQAAARAAERSPRIAGTLDRANTKINTARSKAAGKVPGKLGRAVQSRVDPTRGPGRVGRAVHRMAERPGAAGRFARPIARHGGAAAVGGLGGKAVGAAVGAFAGYSAALRRETARKDKMNSVSKAVANQTGMSQREQRAQIKRKRRNLGLSMVSTGVGAAGVGLLGARELGPRLPKVGATVARHAPRLERAGLGTALVGGGVSSVQGSQSARIQRRDLHAQEKVYGVTKAAGTLVPTRAAGLRSSYLRRTPKGTVRVKNTVTKAYGDPTKGVLTWIGRGAGPKKVVTGPPRLQRGTRVDTATFMHNHHKYENFRPGGRQAALHMNEPEHVYGHIEVGKIDTTMNEHQAKQVTGQYGLKGPLPRHLPREERMRAYEGRYVAAGGPKGEKWQRRSDNLDHVTGGALATGGAAALTELASHKGRIHPKIAPKANRVGLTAAGVGALSELAHRHAQHRAGSYKSSPAGVAAGALRRMRDNTPED